jgi:hypothetical protein
MFIGVVLSQANRSRLIRSILMADSLLQPPAAILSAHG